MVPRVFGVPLLLQHSIPLQYAHDEKCSVVFVIARLQYSVSPSNADLDEVAPVFSTFTRSSPRATPILPPKLASDTVAVSQADEQREEADESVATRRRALSTGILRSDRWVVIWLPTESTLARLPPSRQTLSRRSGSRSSGRCTSTVAPRSLPDRWESRRASNAEIRLLSVAARKRQWIRSRHSAGIGRHSSKTSRADFRPPTQIYSGDSSSSWASHPLRYVRPTVPAFDGLGKLVTTLIAAPGDRLVLLTVSLVNV